MPQTSGTLYWYFHFDHETFLLFCAGIFIINYGFYLEDLRYLEDIWYLDGGFDIVTLLIITLFGGNILVLFTNHSLNIKINIKAKNICFKGYLVP